MLHTFLTWAGSVQNDTHAQHIMKIIYIRPYFSNNVEVFANLLPYKTNPYFENVEFETCLYFYNRTEIFIHF
jgi:hypothetical protein